MEHHETTPYEAPAIVQVEQLLGLFDGWKNSGGGSFSGSWSY